MIRARRLPVFGLLALLLLPGCDLLKGKNEAKGEDASNAAASADKAEAPTQAVGRPATEEEAAQFGEDLMAAYASGKNLGKFLDAPEIVRIATAGTDPEDVFLKGTSEGMLKRMSADMRRIARTGGSMKILANREVDGERLVKMRILHPDGAFNYHDYIVVTSGRNTRAIDVRVLTSGERMSATVRRTLLPLIAEQKRSILDRLTKEESAFIKAFPDFQKLTQFQNNPQGAIDAYHKLPASVRNDKAVMMFWVTASGSLEDDRQYIQAMKKFRDTFPDDPAIHIVNLDFYYLKKEFAKSLEATRQIEKLEGKDAHLNMLRAGLHAEMEAYDLALQESETGLAIEPDHPGCMNIAIAMNLGLEKEDAALKWIKSARELSVPLKDVSVNPQYIEFIARPEIAAQL